MIETKPTITTHPSSQKVIISNNFHRLSISCEAMEAESYNWEKQDGSISFGATGVNTKTLTIVNLTPNDAGNYRCVVDHGSDLGFTNFAKITVEG